MALGLPVAGAAADSLVGPLGAAAAPEPADGEVQPCADEQERCQSAEGGEAPEHGADSLPDDVPDRGVDQERAQVTEAPATTSAQPGAADPAVQGSRGSIEHAVFPSWPLAGGLVVVTVDVREHRSPFPVRHVNRAPPAGAGLGGAAEGADGGEGREVEVERDVRRARRSGLSWVTLAVVAVVVVAAVAQAWPLVAVGWLVLAARQVRAVRASYRNEPSD